MAYPPRCGALGVVLMCDTKGTSQPDQIISEHNFWSYLPFMERILDQGLGLRYLIVHRVALEVAPFEVSPSTFMGGEGVIESHVIDLVTLKRVASFSNKVASQERIRFEYRDEQDRDKELMRAIWSSVWSEAQRVTKAALIRSTGARILESY